MTAFDTTTSTTATPTTTASRGRGTTVALWTAQILLGLFLVVASALPKLVGEQTAVDAFAEIGIGQWFRYVVGVLELAGGIGLLVPRYAGAAALGLVGLMVGAVLTQVFVFGTPLWALLPLAFGVVFVLIARARRDEVRAFAGSLRR